MNYTSRSFWNVFYGISYRFHGLSTLLVMTLIGTFTSVLTGMRLVGGRGEVIN